jgi:hypothetical protein
MLWLKTLDQRKKEFNLKLNSLANRKYAKIQLSSAKTAQILVDNL